MAAPLHHGLSRARLRLVLGLLFLALAVPSAIIVVQTQRQLKWEALHQQRELAAELAERIDTQLQRVIALEEARSYGDYGFETIVDPAANVPMLQRSPLARWPLPSDWPGLLGWFQIDPVGGFSTPLLPEPENDPAAAGLSSDERQARIALRDALLDVLASNQLAERRRVFEPDTASDEALNAASTAPTLARTDAPPPPASSRRQAASADRPGPVADHSVGQSMQSDLSAVAPTLNEPASAESRAIEHHSVERAKPASTPAAPAAQIEFDRLRNTEERPAPIEVAERRLDDDTTAKRTPIASPAAFGITEPAAQRGRRLEQSALPAVVGRVGAAVQVRVFESELDPFEFARLDSGHFVLFRRVWRDGERSIQGALIEADAFVRSALAAPFAANSLAASADLSVTWRGDIVERVPGRASRAYVPGNDALSGTLLHRARLSAPLSDLELIWTLRQLPATPGAAQLAWSGAVLFGVLLLGFLALYRLGLRQIRLARQQHDFIAAVSHELKTPLTSIRMYGELLRAGWASEEKKREYYDYIHDESERLSRLIANVLQLARLERDELQLELRTYPAPMLFDLIRSKVQAQIESAGFEVEFRLDPACAELQAAVDADALVQVLINLVDNALKFSARAPRRRLEIALSRAGDRLQFAVRDYGPGVPPALRRRIFELFFRAGNELTRETRGTGIGLALVRQLAQGMGGEVEVVAGDPGAEFRLLLPLTA